MDTVAHAPKPLGPSEIARDWAERGYKVSRQYVSRLMRKGIDGERLEGEHASSLAAAWLWRTLRTDVRAPLGGAGENQKTGGEDPANVSDFSAGGGDSLESELERVKSLVREQAKNWESAVRARPYDSFAAARARKEYLDAVQTRIEVEGLIADYHKSLGLTVDLLTADRLVDQRLSPLRAALHGLDKDLAKEFFPEDPAKHRPRFRRVIARATVASLAIARAKRRFLTTPAHVSPRAA
jgi:hypothetical protein